MKPNDNTQNLWKDNTESPEQNQLVIWEDKKGMHAGRFDTCYKCFCTCANYFVDLRNVKRWRTLDDFDSVLQSHTELQERNRELEKLLSYAVRKIREIKGHNENGLLNGGGLYTSSEPFDQIVEKLTTPQDIKE